MQFCKKCRKALLDDNEAAASLVPIAQLFRLQGELAESARAAAEKTGPWCEACVKKRRAEIIDSL